ncbi:N-acetylmuramoyl-L-alanine amidase [Cellulosimicrobium sp. JZ28]|uniref:N-acetylmuramoyl-L-alanine amidase n=1 Tax=Cellulosimicrobium sp. JZ28 TaxID=1906273 RepID=UPI00188B259A|nr:N-acetylmuramoyl-L-alanine amidase [Cellulosimicrobium sp. JZ28]
MGEFYGLDHPNRRSPQIGNPRRGGTSPSGTIVIHTAECAADLVGPDTSAEGVANYLTNRTTPGSYHRIVDSDSVVKYAPLGYETWHCRFTNRWSIGISFAVQAHMWAQYPPAFVTAILRQGARTTAAAIRDLKTYWGIDVPLVRITREQALARRPGFIGHGETDPTRRSDPGPAFPWARFLDMVRAELTGTPTASPTAPAAPPLPPPDNMEEILMGYPFIIRGTDQDAWTLVLSPTKQVPISSTDVKANRVEIIAAFGEPRTVGKALAASIRAEIG